MKKSELLDLIALAIQKDQKSQNQLISLFWSDVYHFVLKKINDKNLADEITVNVFSKVLSKLDLYDAEFQFKTWILTIAQNTVIDYWRKYGNKNDTTDATLEDIKNEFAKSPEELMIDEENEAKIKAIINSMGATYADIIRLRFFEEKSIKEIAEELHLSVSNTKVRIMRAKKILAQLLEESNYLSE